MFTYLKLFINRLTEFLHWRFDLVKTINITEIKNGSPLETLPLLIKFIMMLCVYSPVQTDATLLAKNSNIVGFYMLRPFAHPVACCCVLLGSVASVCTPVQHTTSSPHFSSGIVERAKRERAWKSPLREKATRGGEREKWGACRLFSRGVIFTRARVLLALLSLRKNGDYS